MKRKKSKPLTRSQNMAKVKNKDTSIEKKLRQALWHRGYRYRKNDKSVFGKPDVVFKSKRIAIFCDSEFWHGKHLTEHGMLPQTNTEFWHNKLMKNIERDKEVTHHLEEDGWIVIRLWAKDIKDNLDHCISKIEAHVKV